MRKLVVSAWFTLDGIFDADSMDVWWNPYNSDERATYIKEMINGADALLFGRTTYEMLASYWPDQKNDNNGPASKLNSVPKFVVSSTLKKDDWNNSTIIKDNVVEEIAKLKKLPGQEIQIEGSATLVQSLMDANLIDEFRFLVTPIIVGNGKRFFKDGMSTTGMTLVKTKTLALGVVALNYQADKKDPKLVMTPNTVATVAG
jgi:dihydrofolate reductase